MAAPAFAWGDDFFFKLALARAHRAQAVAQGAPGGDAFGDLAVDDKGWGAGDLIFLDPGVGALFDRLDIFDLGEALLDRRGGEAALLIELVDAPAIGERGETLRGRQLRSEEHTSELQSIMRR